MPRPAAGRGRRRPRTTAAPLLRSVLLPLVPLLLAACGGGSGADDGRTRIVLSGSEVGTEGELLARQVAAFEAENPDVEVEIRSTPDDATQRHQLYVQWLAARVGTPDVLQLDVVWTPEFAAAGWILPLERFHPPADSFFAATVEANTWAGELHALPWFVDVGMLYWRTDRMPRAPRTIDEMARFARAATEGADATETGIVWQGARYEGLVTVFLEFLGAHGGRIVGDGGRIAVADPPAVRALEAMRAQVARGVAPADVLTWHEEETRFAFQNGRAAMMRNWPYAHALLSDPAESAVAGRFAVAPMPAAPGGAPTAALGGAQLAVNARSAHPDAAYRLVRFLTGPERMLERAAATGQFPARPAPYDDPRLAAALAVPPAEARAVIERAVPRPVTPVWTQLSGILQLHLHRALAGQVAPADALRAAAGEMDAVMEETGIRDHRRRLEEGPGDRIPDG